MNIALVLLIFSLTSSCPFLAANLPQDPSAAGEKSVSEKVREDDKKVNESENRQKLPQIKYSPPTEKELALIIEELERARSYNTILTSVIGLSVIAKLSSFLFSGISSGGHFGNNKVFLKKVHLKEEDSKKNLFYDEPLNGKIESMMNDLKNRGTVFQSQSGWKCFKESFSEEGRLRLATNSVSEKYYNVKSGIVLAGKSGCGKTSLAKAIANDLGLVLYTPSSGFNSHYVGRNENALEKIFRDCNKLGSPDKPAILLLDDFGIKFAARCNSENRVHDAKFVDTFLRLCQNLKNVFVIITSNFELDPAITNNSERLFYINIPEPSVEALGKAFAKRLEILANIPAQIQSKAQKLDKLKFIKDLCTKLCQREEPLIEQTSTTFAADLQKKYCYLIELYKTSFAKIQKDLQNECFKVKNGEAPSARLDRLFKFQEELKVLSYLLNPSSLVRVLDINTLLVNNKNVLSNVEAWHNLLKEHVSDKLTELESSINSISVVQTGSASSV